MKLLFLILICVTTACTHYQTSSISKNRVMVAKNVNVLGLIQYGDVFTCKTDNSGRIDSCVKNHVEDSEEKQARLEREAAEKARRAANNNY